uniref:uncharacterized protein LOC122593670 n=1 Tax=Erigeron canadensis TaxID=72917 RepID=UPI001CB8B19D|nr:uncharacterized protein LOC122593670 [Erigeron canadensis]XP_043622042.1 uncharacterized protein LOC122593670 [Erigeron canadensis]
MEFESKLEQTLTGILKSADLETATELSVRKEAENLLGIELSDLDSKRLVRQTVESFLLSNFPADEVIEERDDVGELQKDKSPVFNGTNGSEDAGGRIICRLPGMRRVSVKKFKGTKLVSIREYYQKQGTVFPSGRGVTLNPKEWAAFRSSFSDIEEAITKMELRMRGGESIERNQTEAEASNPPSILASEEDRGHAYVFPPQPLVPISTTRFTGKNYYCWKRQMEFFLSQLQVFYVLNYSCPNIPASPEASFQEISQAKSQAQKWINDEYICRHSILNSLSDQLFDLYSIKTLNARELWDELTSSYADDFGTRISHVNNYIQFQMVDGVSVLEQVQELHRIAGTITTSGIHIDENFHVSAIISKLPPSWKQVRVKLMQEEHLPLDKLIYLLKDEEDCRNQQKRTFKKKDMRGVCFGCHQEGHIRRDCPLTRSHPRDQREG